MTNTRNRVILLAISLSAAPAPALDPAKPFDQYRYEVWEEAEGLPHYSINAIAQDKDGYLWLGSFYGLVRFDGVQFKVFDTASTPSLPSNKIWALAAAPDGKLWIGTGRGLAVLENGEVKRIPETGAGSARTLLVSTRGEVWAGFLGGGLFVRRGILFEPTGLAAETVRSLAEDRHGNIWVGTHSGLYRLTPHGFVHYTKRDGLPDDRVFSLREDQDGAMWIGTASGLACLRSGRIETYNHIPALRNRDVRALQKDRDGSLWIGMFGGGLARRALGRFEFHRNPRPLVSEAITAVYEDREGGIWIGASGGGLARLRDVPFHTLTTEKGLAGNLVQTVTLARDGTIWVGYNGNGVNRLSADGRPRVTLRRENGLSSDDIWSLHECPHGDLWVGTYGGEVNRIRNGQVQTLGRAQGLPNNPVLSLLEDRSGDLWIATSNGGLAVRRNGRTHIYRKEDGLASNNVRILHQDHQGRLWIGTDQGLNVLQDGQFLTYTKRDGLAGDFVHSLYEEADGTLWIGSFDGGLTRFRDGKFSAFTPESGFPARVVFQILEDDSQNLWISSSTGIFRVSKADLNDIAAGKARRLRVSQYGIPDGLNSRECSGGQPGGVRTADGRLLFPTMKGLAIVDPKRIVTNLLPPPVVIEEFRADSVQYSVKDGIELPAGARNLEIRYAALSLTAPAKNTFRYRLEPYDSDWIESGNRRTAYYTNLPPGSYRFRVMAANNDGVWNEQGISLPFQLRPHFYQTPAFLLACLLAALALVWAGHTLRLRALVGLNKELESRVAERTVKLEEANRELSQLVEQIEISRARAEQASRVRSEFVANVSHELRTPMNGVLGMLGLALETPLRPDQQEYLQLAQESAESLLTLLNDILDFSKIDAGHVSIEAAPFDPRATVEAVMQMMRPRAQAKGLQLTSEVSPALPESVLGDAARLRQILVNLIGNAIKFTDAGGVTVRAETSDEDGGVIEMRFSVTDTGIGIAEQDLAAIFEPFRQADNSATRRFGGTGLGLTISAKLAAAMGGRIWVESRQGAGSTFHFTVRARRPSHRSAAPAREPVATGPFPLTVLLAEDDRINQKVASTLLEKLGCKVDVVDNGREAVLRLNTQDYDLVLMDVHMPELDGLAATAAIREGEKRKGGHVPIIALTALAMAGDAERCLEVGMDGYISKPVSRAALAETLASVAPQKPKPASQLSGHR